MSHSHGQNGAATAPIPTIDVHGAVAPANDTQCAPAGPFGLPRTYWVLWSGVLLNRLGSATFILLGIYLTRERGLRPELAGLVVSLYAVGGLFAGPVGGVAADRAGRRATLLAGTALSGACMVALGFARATAAIVAIAPVLGFFTDLCRPPLQAAVADVIPPAARPRAYGLLYWAINLGFAGASAIGGALAEHHFTLLFVVDGLTTFGYGAVVLLGVPETRPPPSAAAAPPGAGAGGRFFASFRDGPFVRFVLIQLLLLLAFAQILMSLPLDMRARGLGMAQIGWLLGLNGLYIVIAQPIALRVLRGVGPVSWLVAGAALLGLGLGATAFARGPWMYALSGAIWTLGEIGFSTAGPTLVAAYAPADQRGAYQGVNQLAWGIASAAAPTVGSFVLARCGAGALWGGCFAVGLVAAALHLAFTRVR
jgi:MFS family permease